MSASQSSRHQFRIRKRRGRQSLFAFLIMRWPFPFNPPRFLASHLLDPPTLAALKAHAGSRTTGPLVCDDRGERMTRSDIRAVLRQLRRDGKGLLSFPVDASLSRTTLFITVILGALVLLQSL